MFSMPRDIPRSFTDEEAGWILRECWQSRNPQLSKSQLQSIRQMLSYTYQLATGRHHSNNAYDPCNWPSVQEQWGCQDPESYAPPTKKLKAEVCPEPNQLKKAFTTEWSPDCGMPYPQWCVANQITYDWAVNGNRSGEGLRRVKQSVTHEFTPSQGWMRTKLLGGRPKLPGTRKRRDWWNYRTCLCPGGDHQGLPDDWKDHLDNEHNPTKEWCTICPLTCFEFIRGMLPETDHRTYVRWLPDQQRYAVQDYGIGKKKLVPEARRWLNIQGANPDNLIFCSNSGRKALANWCSEYSVKYSHSFQIHGDLYTTWKYFYQSDLGADPQFKERTQSKEVDEATAALWKFARGIGRGRTNRDDPTTFDFQLMGQLIVENLRAMGHGTRVNAILDGHRH